MSGSAYLDHAAATPLDPRVREAMLPFVGGHVAGPQAIHEGARPAHEALEGARESVAVLVGADPEQVIFTSGAVEARNLAVLGLLRANGALGPGIVASAVEHPATIAACRGAVRDGARLDTVPVDRVGRIDRAALAAAVGDDTALICLIHGQGEIGTLQDVPGLTAAARARRSEARIVVDAGETVGLVPVDARAMDADALVVGGPPLGAPPWAGALVVRPGARLRPLIVGGVEEAGKRAGPEILPGIVALGAAAEIAAREMTARAARARALGERLVEGLLAVPGVRLNGPREGRIPGHVQVSVEGVEGESLTLALSARGVAASPGSACSADAGKAAPVLEAIGLTPPWTHSALLLTARHGTSDAEIDHAIAAFAEAVGALRALSPLRP